MTNQVFMIFPKVCLKCKGLGYQSDQHWERYDKPINYSPSGLPYGYDVYPVGHMVETIVHCKACGGSGKELIREPETTEPVRNCGCGYRCPHDNEV